MLRCSLSYNGHVQEKGWVRASSFDVRRTRLTILIHFGERDFTNNLVCLWLTRNPSKLTFLMIWSILQRQTSICPSCPTTRSSCRTKNGVGIMFTYWQCLSFFSHIKHTYPYILIHTYGYSSRVYLLTIYYPRISLICSMEIQVRITLFVVCEATYWSKILQACRVWGDLLKQILQIQTGRPCAPTALTW